MINSKLIMVRGKASNSEEWGEFDFLSLPSPGDRVVLNRDGAENYATVIAVHHYPTIRASGDQPSAEIVAKWTGSAPRLR